MDSYNFFWISLFLSSTKHTEINYSCRSQDHVLTDMKIIIKKIKFHMSNFFNIIHKNKK